MRQKNVVGGLALVAVGAAAAVAATHVQVRWGTAASAAPPVVAADVKPALPPPSKEQLSEARMLSRTFTQVASQLSPSVVRISITKGGKNARNAVQRGGRGGNPFEGTPFERFFGGPDNGGGGFDSPQPKQHGTGSGVVIDTKGYILTNNHVVEDADEVKVSFSDGKTVAGKVVGTDPRTDLAVVKVDGVDVKAAKLGDSDKMQVGEWVIAIGNPFGFDHTVTVGVLSAKGRSGLQDGRNHYEDFLQTDASINPGNSGGPLINLDGEVVGINTMIAGIGTGIGFAVPTSMARPVADQLIQHGKVRRPYLGIVMQDLTPELQKTMGQNAPPKGAIVSTVQNGSPAEKAGVKDGDVIVDIEGKSVGGSKDVQRTVLTKNIGQKLDLTVWRDGKTMHVTPVTQELPGDTEVASRGEPASSPKAKLGLGLTSLTPNVAQQLGINPRLKGVVVTNVRDGSPAQEAGVREGDVLVEVDRHAVASADEAAKLFGVARPGGHLVRVLRGNEGLFLVIPAA